MLRAKLDLAIEQLISIRQIVDNASRLRDYSVPYGLEEFCGGFSTVDLTYARTFDYCASITRAYATFERLVLGATEQLVVWRVNNDRAAFLSEPKTLLAYELGVAEIFRRHTEARFADVDKAQVAQSLAIFHSTSEGECKFLADPFFATLPNLRISHIDSLLQSLGCQETLSGWLSESQEVKDFCDDTGLNVADEIKDLVERRNEAAHGNELPQNIWGPSEISIRIDMLILLCRKFYELVIYIAVSCSERLLGACSVGSVNALWKSAGAFELKTTGRLVQHGATIIFFKPGAVLLNKIKGIQLEGVNCKAYFGPADTMLGISLARPQLPKKRMSLVQAADLPNIARLVEN